MNTWTSFGAVHKFIHTHSVCTWITTGQHIITIKSYCIIFSMKSSTDTLCNKTMMEQLNYRVVHTQQNQLITWHYSTQCTAIMIKNIHTHTNINSTYTHTHTINKCMKCLPAQNAKRGTNMIPPTIQLTDPAVNPCLITIVHNTSDNSKKRIKIHEWKMHKTSH